MERLRSHFEVGYSLIYKDKSGQTSPIPKSGESRAMTIRRVYVRRKSQEDGRRIRVALGKIGRHGGR